MGDTAGHVRVLDVSKGVNISDRISARNSFVQVKRECLIYLVTNLQGGSLESPQ